MNVDTLDHFTGEREDIPIGHKFDGFDDGETVIEPGDIVVWRDPDAGQHSGGCEFIHNAVYVGKIRGVYAVEYTSGDGYAVELDATTPVGRIDADGPYTAVRGERFRSHIPMIGEDGTQSYVDSFLNSDFSEYLAVEDHLGEDGVPAGMWKEYQDSDRTGPGCPYCTGEKGQDGTNSHGE